MHPLTAPAPFTLSDALPPPGGRKEKLGNRQVQLPTTLEPAAGGRCPIRACYRALEPEGRLSQGLARWGCDGTASGRCGWSPQVRARQSQCV